MALKTLQIKTLPLKIMLSGGILVGFGLMLLFAKWSIGNAISTQVDDIEVAKFAVSLAPADPQTHYTLAVLRERTFLPDDLKNSLVEYRKTVSQSPRDYRLWLTFAKALERSGDSDGALSAFNRSLELAPNYSHVTWANGNFLLRQGKTDEAFSEIRKAAESNSIYLEPAISAAWQFLDGNLDEIRGYFAASPKLNSVLASKLADEKRFDEAFQVWNSLAADDKKTKFKEQGDSLFNKMIGAKKFRNALDIYRSISVTGDAVYEAEAIANGGFEIDVVPVAAHVFDWRLGDGIQPQVLIDTSQKIEGQRSLVFVFSSNDGKDFRTLSQTVVIGSQNKYAFSFSYKADLKTSATLRWEATDIDGKVLSQSEPFFNRIDWTKVSVEFNTGTTDEAVNIRLVRAECPGAICPISGKIWFDDFRLSR